MNKVDVFSARDLRIHSGNLLNEAEQGNLSIITKHGKPAILAIPFDKELLTLGINRDLALILFEKGVVTLAKAARLASMSMEEFLDLVSKSGIVVVDYPVEELDNEAKI